jgi:hypothetical protein
MVRDPVSTCPMLLPVIDTADPTLMIKAPIAPMKIAAPSASGVADWATSGRTPVATTEVSVITAATVRIVITKANGTSRRGLAASPAGMPVTS